VRIRYYGLLANRHREHTRALCREVLLPGPPARPKLTKLNRQSLLQTLTGVGPMRCEICGQNALHLVEEVVPLSERQRKEPRAPPP
jgi:S-adenosylmethionine:diacylglycerol 3-amino-3-carboxypropyl transferase